MSKYRYEIKVIISLVALLVIILTLSLSSCIYLMYSSEAVISHCSDLKLILVNHDLEAATTKLKHLRADWDDVKPVWYIITDHDHVDTVDQYLTKAESYLNDLQFSSAHRQLELLTKYLENVSILDSPSIANIL